MRSVITEKEKRIDCKSQKKIRVEWFFHYILDQNCETQCLGGRRPVNRAGSN